MATSVRLSLERGIQLPTVSADRGQLELLFLNLISNDPRFRRSDRSRIHLSVTPSEGGWRFSNTTFFLTLPVMSET